MKTSTNLKHLVILILLIPSDAQDSGASTSLSPTLIFPDEEIQANVGNEAQLNCGINGQHRRCLWRDNNGVDIQIEDINSTTYTGQYGRPNNTNDNQCGIIIKNVTKEDDGSWTCLVMVKGGTLTDNLTLDVFDTDYFHDYSYDDTTAPGDEYNLIGHRDSKSYNGTGVIGTQETQYPAPTAITEDISATYTSDDSTDSFTNSSFDGPGLGRNGKLPQGTEHPTPKSIDYPPPAKRPTAPTPDHHATSDGPKNQTNTAKKESSNGLWIALILIAVVIILPLVVCIFWYFCCRTGSHDIAQMEGDRNGVEMSPIVRDSGDLETIAEEQSASQQLLNEPTKLEVLNEQKVDDTPDKEEDKGISNKAFEESFKEDDKSETNLSDKSDQNDKTKEEDDTGVTNQAYGNLNEDKKEDRPQDPMENSEMKNVEIIEEDVQDQQEISEKNNEDIIDLVQDQQENFEKKNEDITDLVQDQQENSEKKNDDIMNILQDQKDNSEKKNDDIIKVVQDQEENSLKKESSSDRSDSESSDVNSTDWEKVGDKELQDVFDASREDDIIDDSGAANEQREDVRDDYKANNVDKQEINQDATQYEAQAQELVTSAIDSAIQQVEGGSPSQGEILSQLPNGELSEEDTQKRDDVNTKK